MQNETKPLDVERILSTFESVFERAKYAVNTIPSGPVSVEPEVIGGLDDEVHNETLQFVIGRAIPEFWPKGKVFTVTKRYFMKMSPMIDAAFSSQDSSDDTEPPSAYDKMHPSAFAKIAEYVEKYGHEGPQKSPNSPCDSIDFSFCVPRIIDADGRSHPGWDATFVESIFEDPKNRHIYMETLRHANFFQIDCLVRKLACRIGCVLMGKKQLMKKPDEKSESGEERDETLQEYTDRLDDLIDPARVLRNLDKVVYLDVETGKPEVFNLSERRPVTSGASGASAAADDAPMTSGASSAAGVESAPASADDVANSSAGKRKLP